jgi:hypothetical protein
MASSNSRLKISSTFAAPFSPATANPHKIGRPTSTARAPSAIAWSPTHDPRDSGAIAVLFKPVDLEQLEQALQNAAQQLAF